MAFHKRKNEERLYRTYVTDALKVIAHNTGMKSGGQDLNVRYADLLKDMENPRPELSEEEIVDNLKQKLKGNK